MKSIYLVLYIFSTVATILMFVLVNRLTEPLISGGSGGGNGNPGLFPIIFLFPFGLVFIYGTYSLLKKWISNNFSTIAIKGATIASFIGVCLILWRVLGQALKLRYAIVEKNPSFDQVSDISLLNTYSNSIFFNEYTFLMLILAVLFVAGVRSLLANRKMNIRD